MSRFVPAGSAPEKSQDLEPEDDAWAAARREVNTHYAPKKNAGSQEPEKSLYDTLQANKAAKQAEFEESIRLKNQFKTLDEDDVDFLDSVLESERAKETAVKRETAEQLETYRKQQEAAVKADLNNQTEPPPTVTESWITRKRRKKELENPISKLRKTSTTGGSKVGPTTASTEPKQNDGPETTSNLPSKPDTGSSSTKSSQPEHPQPVALGLGAYSSDDE